LVLYFGASEWDGPMSIHEMLNTQNQRLLDFVPDYRINLIAPMQVPDEDFEKFRTDLRDVMQFIKASNDQEKMERLTTDNERFQQMTPDAAELINLLTDSKMHLTVKEGTVNMCLAIQQMMESSKAAGVLEGRAEGKAEGRVEGKAEGIAEGRLEVLVSLWKKNRLTLQEAAEEAEMTVDEFVNKTGVKSLMN